MDMVSLLREKDKDRKRLFITKVSRNNRSYSFVYMKDMSSRYISARGLEAYLKLEKFVCLIIERYLEKIKEIRPSPLSTS